MITITLHVLNTTPMKLCILHGDPLFLPLFELLLFFLLLMLTDTCITMLYYNIIIIYNLLDP